MQAVILAGGLATRLRPLTDYLPKCMIKIQGKPFLEYQLELLRKNGITEMVLCLGYLADQVINYLGDGSRWGVRLTYSIEDKELLGTGGALKKAYPLLRHKFLVIYGDSYLDFPYSEIIQHFWQTKPDALMVVHRNLNQWDRSNVVVKDGYVTIYDKKMSIPEMKYIDAGLSILTKEVIQEIPENRFYDLADVYQSLARRTELKAFEVKQRFYEVGSSQGLKEFSQLVQSGVLVS